MIQPNIAKAQKAASKEKRLVTLFKQLPAAQQGSLLDFAEFLVSQQPDSALSEEGFPEPKAIPRPEEESVIKAMRRLSETYFMLEKRHILNETSTLMAQHVMQGREAVDVIDDLEAVFRKYYDKARDESQA